jgi:hypothetical protein
LCSARAVGMWRVVMSWRWRVQHILAQRSRSCAGYTRRWMGWVALAGRATWTRERRRGGSPCAGEVRTSSAAWVLVSAQTRAPWHQRCCGYCTVRQCAHGRSRQRVFLCWRARLAATSARLLNSLCSSVARRLKRRGSGVPRRAAGTAADRVAGSKIGGCCRLVCVAGGMRWRDVDPSALVAWQTMISMLRP